MRSAARMLSILLVTCTAAAVAGPVHASAAAPPTAMQQDPSVDAPPAGQTPAGEPNETDDTAAANQASTDGPAGAESPAAEPDLQTVPWTDTATELEPWQILALFLLGLALIGAIAVFVYSRVLATRRVPIEDSPDGEWPLPPLVIPAREAPEGADRPRNDLRPLPAMAATSPAATVRTQGPSPTRGRPVLHSAPIVAEVMPTPSDAEQGVLVEAGPIRFHRPPEGTLQLLPGRLEILSGNERQEEIRFVRVAGQDAVVTFGRSEGEPHLHIQLRSRTVSRLHASIRFQTGRWYIANLSRTNPVVLNGQQMSAADAVHVALEDGDQIEMGEVIFRFRSR